MSIQSRDTLKTQFSANKVPTGADFSNFLDSVIHQNDDLTAIAQPKASTTEVQVATNDTKVVTPKKLKDAMDFWVRLGKLTGLSDDVIATVGEQLVPIQTQILAIQNQLTQQTSASLTVSKTSLSSFVTPSSTPSSVQQFALSGSNLPAEIYITCPTGFEAKVSSNSAWADAFAVQTANGSLAITNIDVRAKGTVNSSGTVLISGTALQPKYVAVTVTISSGVVTSSMTIVPKTTYTRVSTRGDLGLRFFTPGDFTPPANFIAIWGLPGRGQLLAQSDDVFNHGFTHVDNRVPSSDLPNSKKMLMLTHDDNNNQSIMWTAPGQANTDLPNMRYSDGSGLHAHNLASLPYCYFSTMPYALVHLDIENVYTNFTANQDNINLWTALNYYFQAAVHGFNSATLYGAFLDNLQILSEVLPSSPSAAPILAPFNNAANNQALPSGSTPPSAIDGHKPSDFTDVSFSSTYFGLHSILKDGNYTLIDGTSYALNHVTDRTNYLGQTLLLTELATSREGTRLIDTSDNRIKLLITNFLFIEEIALVKRFKKRYYKSNGVDYFELQYDKADLPYPDEVVEACIIMTQMVGVKGYNKFDYDPTTTLTAGAEVGPVNSDDSLNYAYFTHDELHNPTAFNNQRLYTSVQAFRCALRDLFGNHVDGQNNAYNLKTLFFDHKCNYHRENTEVDYHDGNGFQKLNSVQISEQDKPFVRSLDYDGKILVAAHKPYASSNYSQPLTIKLGSYTRDFTLSGKNTLVFFDALS